MVLQGAEDLETLSEDARLLMSDKDALLNTMQATHDTHTSKIDAVEDALLNQEASCATSLISQYTEWAHKRCVPAAVATSSSTNSKRRSRIRVLDTALMEQRHCGSPKDSLPVSLGLCTILSQKHSATDHRMPNATVGLVYVCLKAVHATEISLRPAQPVPGGIMLDDARLQADTLPSTSPDIHVVMEWCHEHACCNRSSATWVTCMHIYGENRCVRRGFGGAGTGHASWRSSASPNATRRSSQICLLDARKKRTAADQETVLEECSPDAMWRLT